MLKRLELKNFRKHENLQLDFSPGMIALRGANESGKSTLSEAIGYAFFGSKGLRETLDNVVTWGQKTATLQVVLHFHLDGVDYTVTRGKSGAELRYEGGVVTGQNEVTGFIERLFGASANLATALWFVSQGTIRGALASGSKATTQLIEELADFALIERIIGLIQENLQVGNPAAAQERVKQTEQMLAQTTYNAATPDTNLLADIKDAEKDLVMLQTAFDKAKAAVVEHDKVLLPLLTANDQREKALVDASLLLVQITQGRESIAALQPVPYDEGEHAVLTMAVAGEKRDREALQERVAAFNALKTLPDTGGTEWQGTLATFQTFEKEQKAEYERLQAEANAHRTAAALAEQEIIHATTCGICGKDLADVPEAVAKNEKAHAKLADAKYLLAKVVRLGADLEKTTDALTIIAGLQKKYEAFLARHGSKWYEVIDDRVPVRIEWKGHPPVESMPMTDNSKALQAIEAAKVAHTRVKAQRELLSSQVHDLDTKRTGLLLEAKRLEKTLGGLLNARNKGDELAAELASLSTLLEGTIQELAAKKTEYAHQEKLWQQAQESKARVQVMLDAAIKDLAELEANNLLLKKVRAARPILVDRLWGVVLSAVTFYFSQMRGSQSTVTRGEGGFLVDGTAVEGLSGSTLDILGLSIRLSLLKTFLPRVSFLILDEPAAACDAERETQMLGTIAASHFDQVLCASHSDVLESFSNQLITL